MPVLAPDLFERLSAPGPRLPWLATWLLEHVWSAGRYDDLGPGEFLERGERTVNELEEVTAAAAPRIYDELLADPPPDRDIRTFLDALRPCAVVIFDGLSLREIPLVLSLAEASGLKVRDVDVGRAAVPSETVDFVEQRLRAGRTSPSQLPPRRELRAAGIDAYYYGHEGQRHSLPPTAAALCLWSAFPDLAYQEAGARFVSHFAELNRRLEAAWRNTVQAIPAGRTILVTSDHGYVFFGAGCSAARSKTDLRGLTDWLGGERCRALRPEDEVPHHPDLAVIPHRGVTMIRGRVQTHPPGPGGTRLYKHGGLSMMEMLTPWVVLEPAPR